jgi:hypothetical protein
MAVYLVYTGADMESYMCALEVIANHNDTLPALGWRTIVRPGLNAPDAPHPALMNGSVQIVIRGAIAVGVTAGDLRQVTGRLGDTFIFLDIEGQGHWTQPHEDEPFQAINIRVTEDWEALRKSFTGWPETMRGHPRAVSPPV